MKRQKKGEAALLVEGVKQLNPYAMVGFSPSERIITQSRGFVNFTGHVEAAR